MIPPTRRGRAYVSALKVLRRWRSTIFGLGGGAYEAEEPGMTVKWHGGVDQDGKSVTTVLRACTLCAAFVDERNIAYHLNWHTAGTTR